MGVGVAALRQDEVSPLSGKRSVRHWLEGEQPSHGVLGALAAFALRD